MKTGDNDDEERLLVKEPNEEAGTSHGVTIEQTKKVKKRELWDLSRTLTPDNDSSLDENRRLYNFGLRILKLSTYLVVFSVVLISGVVSKSLLVLMSSQLRPNVEAIPYCHQGYSKNIQFVSFTTPEERISWVWAIFFAFAIPELQTLLRGLRIRIFKGLKKPTLAQFLVPFCFETLHTIGLSLMVYVVFPQLDAIKAVMLTNAFCLIPGIFKTLSRDYQSNMKLEWKLIQYAIDMVAIVFQLSALFVWPLIEPHKSYNNHWILPVSAILISFGWWENFVDESSPFQVIKFLATSKLTNMKRNLQRTRYFAYIIISSWKMVVFLAMMTVGTKLNENSWSIAFNLFEEGFRNHSVIVQETHEIIQEPSSDASFLEDSKLYLQNKKHTVFWILGSQVVASYVCYVFGKLACRICIQGFSYALPIFLSVPTTLTVIIALCGIRSNDVCLWDSIFPGYLWWTCPAGSSWVNYFFSEHSWLWILWLFSQVWITLHIMYPHQNTTPLQRTELIFATPMYNGFLIDQSLAMNRRRDEDVQENVEEESSLSDDNDSSLEGIQLVQLNSSPNPPKLIICATMWHETVDEMMKLLKSIMRMDIDNFSKRGDPNTYELESHIFFDDAFEANKNGEFFINSYVRKLITQVTIAARQVHRDNIKFEQEAPTKISTPYGGRLEWTLHPGKTKLICHLKDKSKIRHKKRWSQVMYMYYLIGFEINATDFSNERKDELVGNTFLLALDGDIDFQPSAVKRLIDLMKKNKNVGAACGRIHPTGSGPMVWYQKFEYAVGHWFQKSAEHVMGCVLCSPGCFSLFRAKALMDDNVMHKYTTLATEPIHHVQYDQGEDRWLCTLLLQRGWRVEYSAASDAKTHAPESFNEFYKQRKRWVPSTMANIMDLLLNGSTTVKQNNDISRPFIAYQIFLLVGTILGPGTIFLMLVGAFAVAFKLGQWSSFMWNFFPILVFIFVCYFCEADTQLNFAKGLTTIYALAMVAVVVAIILQITDDGIMAPSSLFLIIIASSFLIAGLIHPLEFRCLFHGFLYYITIPSMYLLLMIYSVFNLNDIKWGTREDPVKSEQEQKTKKEKEKVSEKKKRQSIFEFIPGLVGAKSKPEDNLEIVTYNDIPKIIDEYIKKSHATRQLSAVSYASSSYHDDNLRASNGSDSADTATGTVDVLEKIENSVNLTSLEWLDDKVLEDCDERKLSSQECSFWEGVIEKFLEPLKSNEEDEKKTAQKLETLKNETAFTFLMLNAVFVILVFLLQLQKDVVHVEWPWGAKVNVTFVPGADTVHIGMEYLELEPIGLVFVGIFGTILAIQFGGMLFHQWGTFIHIMADTSLVKGKLSDITSSNQEENIRLKKGKGYVSQLIQARDAEFEIEVKRQHEAQSRAERRRSTMVPRHYLENEDLEDDTHATLQDKQEHLESNGDKTSILFLRESPRQRVGNSQIVQNPVSCNHELGRTRPVFQVFKDVPIVHHQPRVTAECDPEDVSSTAPPESRRFPIPTFGGLPSEDRVHDKVKSKGKKLSFSEF